MIAPQTESIDLVIPSRFTYVGVVRTVAVKICEMANFSEEDVLGFELALDEVCSNAIEHGSGEGGPNVTIRFQRAGSRLRATVSDGGTERTDLGHYLRGDAIPDSQPYRGRGLFVVKHFSDDMGYAYEEGTGTTVWIEKVSGDGVPECEPSFGEA